MSNRLVPQDLSFGLRLVGLLLEGHVTVTPDGGEPVRFGAGELVVFDQGLSCTWDVHALTLCSGDAVAEPRLTGTWMAHLLMSSKELLHTLLIESARLPQRLRAGSRG